MNFSTFRQDATDTLTEPMFMGNSVNVARYDQQRHPIFENIIEKQLSSFGVLKRWMSLRIVRIGNP